MKFYHVNAKKNFFIFLALINLESSTRKANTCVGWMSGSEIRHFATEVYHWHIGGMRFTFPPYESYINTGFALYTISMPTYNTAANTNG